MVKLPYAEIFLICFRYNLAELNYHPTLRFPNLWTSSDTSDDQESISVDFDRGSTIGGRLSGRFDARSGQTYFVDRDIIVLPEGELRLQPGATLEFENGLGMLVQVFY